VKVSTDKLSFLDVDAFQPGAWLEDLLELAERIDALNRNENFDVNLRKLKPKGNALDSIWKRLVLTAIG
jgi:hypothetical protein